MLLFFLSFSAQHPKKQSRKDFSFYLLHLSYLSTSTPFSLFFFCFTLSRLPHLPPPQVLCPSFFLFLSRGIRLKKKPIYLIAFTCLTKKKKGCIYQLLLTALLLFPLLLERVFLFPFFFVLRGWPTGGLSAQSDSSFCFCYYLFSLHTGLLFFFFVFSLLLSW